MANHVFRLITDRLGPRSAFDSPLPAANRVLYVADGMATVTAGGVTATLAANSGWFHSGKIHVVAGAEGAVLLRYELLPMPQPDDDVAAGQGIESHVTLDAVLALDDADGYLMRCDKVELPPGGIAYTHTHQGGGIRCLLKGAFHVTVDDDTKAIAPDDQPGHFSRVMILPRRLQGQSSIRYVNATDADKPKLQKYTIFVDAFIDT
jgi:hypothetical protein